MQGFQTGTIICEKSGNGFRHDSQFIERHICPRCEILLNHTNTKVRIRSLMLLPGTSWWACESMGMKRGNFPHSEAWKEINAPQPTLPGIIHYITSIPLLLFWFSYVVSGILNFSSCLHCYVNAMPKIGTS